MRARAVPQSAITSCQFLRLVSIGAWSNSGIARPRQRLIEFRLDHRLDEPVHPLPHGFPDEALWLAIVFCDEAIDGGLQVDERLEDAVLQPPSGELCKEALNGIEP
jgi:hypothetical protein